MSWKIKIHPLALAEDFKKIDRSRQERIIADIQKKLSVAPEKYGKPLLGEFKRYRRLAVGDYRVVYRIIREEILVLVIKVGIRRDYTIYKELFARLKKI